MIIATDKQQPITIVAFSGIAPRNSMFEWVKTMDRLPCNFVGVRDPADDWYQTRKQDIHLALSRALNYQQPWLFIGASAGGFAALMFGQMMQADAVLAICPQSACGKAKRDLGDHRWPTHCTDAVPSWDIAGTHYDATVHYAANDEFDTLHANRLNCRKVEHASGGHNLPDVLKKAGLIDGIVAGAVRELAA